MLDLECFDKDPRTECLAHAAAGKCGWQGAWGDWMRDNCAFTCKTCQPTNQTTSLPAAANKTTSLATPQKEGGGTVSLTNKKSQNETGSKVILAKTCKDKSVACPLFSVSHHHQHHHYHHHHNHYYNYNHRTISSSMNYPTASPLEFFGPYHRHGWFSNVYHRHQH